MLRGLGTDYDISIGAAPVDLSSAAVTGKRFDMTGLDSVDIVLIKGAGTAADDPAVTVRASTAASGGTVADLPVVASYNIKGATALAGTEQWTTVTQAASASVSDPGAGGVSAEHQMLVVIRVKAEDMPAGSPYIQLNVADVGANAQLGAVIYIGHITNKQLPASLPAPLR